MSMNYLVLDPNTRSERSINQFKKERDGAISRIAFGILGFIVFLFDAKISEIISWQFSLGGMVLAIALAILGIRKMREESLDHFVPMQFAPGMHMQPLLIKKPLGFEYYELPPEQDFSSRLSIITEETSNLFGGANGFFKEARILIGSHDLSKRGSEAAVIALQLTLHDNQILYFEAPYDYTSKIQEKTLRIYCTNLMRVYSHERMYAFMLGS